MLKDITKIIVKIEAVGINNFLDVLFSKILFLNITIIIIIQMDKIDNIMLSESE